ncbi:hypothetical protein AB0H52_28340, partial [Micromonospora sp. NPDC050695]
GLAARTTHQDHARPSPRVDSRPPTRLKLNTYTLGGRRFMESPKSKRYALAYHRLQGVALDQREAAELIATITEELP